MGNYLRSESGQRVRSLARRELDWVFGSKKLTGRRTETLEGGSETESGIGSAKGKRPLVRQVRGEKKKVEVRKQNRKNMSQRVERLVWKGTSEQRRAERRQGLERNWLDRRRVEWKRLEGVEMEVWRGRRSDHASASPGRGTVYI